MVKPEVITFVKDLFTIIETEKLFIKSPFHDRYYYQLTRNMIQFNNLMKKFEVGDHNLEGYLEWHAKNTPDPPMTRFDFRVELTTLLTNHTLATYEFLKRFFTQVIDLDNLNSKTNSKIKVTSTLGSILIAISKLSNVNKELTDKFFDIDFRNALAHDSWYLDLDGMRYLDPDNNLTLIPYSNLQEKTSTVFALYTTITNEYFKNYYPEVIQYYENEGGDKEANAIFPLYGMNSGESDVDENKNSKSE